MIQHRHFVETDLYDPLLLEQFASKLALFHAMNPPLARHENGVSSYIMSFEDKIDNLLNQKKDLFREYNCKTLLEFNLKSEIHWILAQIASSDSPIVFSHNDFKFGNNLVAEQNQIVLSDFDSSAYFNRGYDFATLFNCFDKKSEAFEFKDESIIKEFISCYVREGDKIFRKQYSENEINSVDHIFLETKVFSLVYCLWTVLRRLHNEFWCLPFTEKSCLVILLFIHIPLNNKINFLFTVNLE